MLYHRMFTIIIAPIMMVLTVCQSFGQQPSLEITISNIQQDKGKIVVAIYKDKSGWLENPFQNRILSTSEVIQTASFKVPYGTYAISIFQDLNENEELDQAIFGIPKEPIGFGNNYRPLGKPKFESALIEHNATSKPQEIKLFKVL